MSKLDLIICGLGGQGIVTANKIVSNVALSTNYEIKVTDIMGLGQRGGQVISHIRIGRFVCSPIIQKGEADVIIALELLEAMRALSYLSNNGTMLVNEYYVKPSTITTGLDKDIDYDIKAMLKKECNFISLVSPYTIIKKESININIFTIANVFFLGILSSMLPFDDEVWIDSITKVTGYNAKDNISIFKIAKSWTKENLKDIKPFNLY